MKKARTLEKESDREESGASVALEGFSLLYPAGYSDVVSGDLLELEPFVPDRFLPSVSRDLSITAHSCPNTILNTKYIRLIRF